MTHLYAIPTGVVNPFLRASRKAVKLIKEQPGFVACHNAPQATLWFFDSLNHAKQARNVLHANGVKTGTYISHFTVSEDGVPTFDSVI